MTPRNQAAGERAPRGERATTDADLADDDGKALEDRSDWSYNEIAKRGERERDSEDA